MKVPRSRRVRILAGPGQSLQLLEFQKWIGSGVCLSRSFRERTIFLSFYVLSLPVYHQSTLLPSSQYFRHHYQLIRRLLCPHPWIQAVYLPGSVSFLKLGILHCPKIHLTRTLLCYCLRCYGELISAWLSFVSPSLPLSLSSFSLVRMSSVIIFGCQSIYTPESFIYLFVESNLHETVWASRLETLIAWKHVGSKHSKDSRCPFPLQPHVAVWRYERHGAGATPGQHITHRLRNTSCWCAVRAPAPVSALLDATAYFCSEH